jgi:hypothetical protein
MQHQEEQQLESYVPTEGKLRACHAKYSSSLQAMQWLASEAGEM